MDIHKIHIFAKNRDAIAALKGYSFQQLKTLKDWLENRIPGNNNIIYCDYEDDILKRDVEKGVSVFKQIKLYSTDFSFSSDSITKSIAHFFMLYVKGDYAFDQVEFLFETNASVVGKTMKDNDAELLREWHENQGNLTDEQVSRIRVRVKRIVEEYVTERYKDLEKDVSIKDQVQKAKSIFDRLTDADFDSFIRCIKWQFDGIEQNEAIRKIVNEVESLIPQVPLPLEQGKEHIYASLLITEVHYRSVQDNPEDRALTMELLDSILLNAGDSEDQRYATTYEDAKHTGKITQFFPGEFQRVINGTRYCRWQSLDGIHKKVWLDLLSQYISLEETPMESKRNAIYEYLFLKIGHIPLEKGSESPIKEDVKLARIYFDNWTHRNHLRDVEEDITLLQLLKAQSHLYSFPIAKEELGKWEQMIQDYLDQEIKTEKNVDRTCELLELRGHLEKQLGYLEKIKDPDGVFDYYRKIVPLLDQTKFYSLSRLYSQMDGFRELVINYELRADLQDALDRFMGEIQPHAQKSGLDHQVALDLVGRADSYLKNKSLRGNLKALDLLHQAKDLWRTDNTKDKHIYCLLQIASVYRRLGMAYASKYYAMVAMWITWHSGKPKLFKLLPKAIGLINMNHFLFGTWVSGMRDFTLYHFLKKEFDEKGLNFDDDRLYFSAICNLAIMMHSIPILHADMKGFIEKVQDAMGEFWKQEINPAREVFAKDHPTDESVRAFINKVLRDRPLSDVGPKRKIKFNALGIEWNIEFDNDNISTAIGESFASILQVTLCDLKMYNKDIFIPGKRVELFVKSDLFDKELIGENQWILSIPVLDSNEISEVTQHYLYLSALVKAVFVPLTGRSKKEIEDLFMEMLSKKKNATLEGTAYQRAFKQTLDFSSPLIEDGSGFKSLPDAGDLVSYRTLLVEKKSSPESIS